MSNGSRESSGPATASCGSNCPIAIKDKLTHHGAPEAYIRMGFNYRHRQLVCRVFGYEAGWGKMTYGLKYNARDGYVTRGYKQKAKSFGTWQAKK